jgi:hypothetical protein
MKSARLSSLWHSHLDNLAGADSGMAASFKGPNAAYLRRLSAKLPYYGKNIIGEQDIPAGNHP